MSSRSLLDQNRAPNLKAILDRARPAPPFVFADPQGRHRTKIWDVSPMFHCSIIGTCLTAAELRHFIGKLGQPDARTATDHDLHSRGVSIASKRDDAAKMLNKTIDKRHETALKRFAKAGTPQHLREMWKQALAAGDISGAYWAILTHPASDRALINEVFGEVHMLSHLVGSSNRLDIARLRMLERDLGASAEKIARQEARLQAESRERSALIRRIEEFEAAAGQQAAREQAVVRALSLGAPDPDLQLRFEAAKAHVLSQALRLKEAEARVQAAEDRAAVLSKQNAQLLLENAALETAMRIETDGESAGAVCQDWQGLTILYVGGRPKLVEHLKMVTAQRGIALLAHDGGIEDNPALLPGLVSQADAALFPMDCISHMAVGKVKKVCRDAGKAFIPLRTASLASFLAALGHLDKARAPAFDDQRAVQSNVRFSGLAPIEKR